MDVAMDSGEVGEAEGLAGTDVPLEDLLAALGDEEASAARCQQSIRPVRAAACDDDMSDEEMADVDEGEGEGGAVGDDDDDDHRGGSQKNSASTAVESQPPRMERRPLRSQIEDCRARIAKLNELKVSQLEEEEFMAAHETKERIKAEEKLLQELRHYLCMTPTPSRGSSTNQLSSGVAAKPGPRVSVSIGLRASPTKLEDVVMDDAGSSAGDADAASKNFSSSVAAATAAAVAETKTRANLEPVSALSEAVAAGDLQEQAEGHGPANGEEVEAEEAAGGDSVIEWCDVPENPDLVKLADDESDHPFVLPRDVHERLYSYQRQGVAWMARLSRGQQGGILADEMGLGKTVQICALLNGLRRTGARHALVLVPVTLMDQWAEEAKLWCPEWPVHIYYGPAAQRAQALRGISLPEGGLLLTSYAMLSNADERLFQVLLAEAGSEPGEPASSSAPGSGRGGRGRGTGKGSGRGKAGRGAQLGPVAPLAGAAGAEAAAPSQAVKRRRVTGKRDQAGTETPSATELQPRGAGGDQPEEQPKAPGESKAWDLVVCDEAHRMKNISTLLGKSLRRLHAKCRLLLTGTPIQNVLQDLWAQMDFAQPGLLGNHQTFVKHFSDPIDRGSVRGAGPFALALKKHLAARLRDLIAPHLLRRTKVGTGLQQGAAEQEAQQAVSEDAWLLDEGLECKQLPPKRETIIWLIPSDEQMVIYKQVLETSELIREAAAKGKLGIEVFRAIGLLKRLCNHPLLALPMPKKDSWRNLLTEANDSLGSQDAGAEAEAKTEEGDAEDAATRLVACDAVPDSITGLGASAAADSVPDDARAGKVVETMLRKLPRNADSLLAQSAKLRCLALLLPSLVSRGHRILIFSQSVKMLDLVQVCVLKPYGLRCLRIDGQTEPCARAEKVAKFQKQRERFQCMLLTTSVGGVGLNLTGADRVVLVDPAWNPATDAQAADRAYRIGQTKEVKVYRLVTSGLIEDKMFRLQVYKLGLTQTALEGDRQHRYFTGKEIRALFEWVDPALGETRRLLQAAESSEASAKAADEAVKQAADEDGASAEGWLGEWMAAGASDYTQVVNGFKHKEASQDDASAMVSTAKDRLNAAEESAQQAQAASLAAESVCEAVQLGIAEATAAIQASIQARAKADGDIKERRAELTQAMKAESSARQQLERATRAKLAAQDQELRAAQAQAQAEVPLNAAVQAASETSETVRSAEERLSKAFDDVKALLSSVNQKTGRALTEENGPPGSVNMAAGKLTLTVRTMNSLREALDTAACNQAQLEAVDDELAELAEVETAAEVSSPARRSSKGGESPSRGQASDSPSQASGGDQAAERASSPGATEAHGDAAAQGAAAAQAAAERAEERARLEQEQAKAFERAEETRKNVLEALSDLQNAGLVLVESFSKAGDHSSDKQVRTSQATARGLFKQMAPAWVSLRKAQDTWCKATATRRKHVLKATKANAMRMDSRALLAEREREYAQAVEDETARRQERAAVSQALSDVEAARRQAQMEENEWRRRKEELKVEAIRKKEALKPARSAVREAAKLRDKAQTDCSKVEKSQMKMEAATSSALERLQSEEYDAKQVEQAYEQRKRALSGDA